MATEPATDVAGTTVHLMVAPSAPPPPLVPMPTTKATTTLNRALALNVAALHAYLTAQATKQGK